MTNSKGVSHNSGHNALSQLLHRAMARSSSNNKYNNHDGDEDSDHENEDQEDMFSTTDSQSAGPGQLALDKLLSSVEETKR